MHTFADGKDSSVIKTKTGMEQGFMFNFWFICLYVLRVEGVNSETIKLFKLDKTYRLLETFSLTYTVHSKEPHTAGVDLYPTLLLVWTHSSQIKWNTSQTEN